MRARGKENVERLGENRRAECEQRNKSELGRRIGELRNRIAISDKNTEENLRGKKKEILARTKAPKARIITASERLREISKK